MHCIAHRNVQVGKKLCSSLNIFDFINYPFLSPSLPVSRSASRPLMTLFYFCFMLVRLPLIGTCYQCAFLFNLQGNFHSEYKMLAHTSKVKSIDHGQNNKIAYSWKSRKNASKWTKNSTTTTTISTTKSKTNKKCCTHFNYNAPSSK